ncbi:MAG: hypothetical protein JWP84_4978 [Tardiphaga sp.]|jgi:hypothetical protein|nr:hypothetical protein [Tardiphaga sp.]MDB5633176.1 hypothetical protein [Tardiphaga sp.]
MAAVETVSGFIGHGTELLDRVDYRLAETEAEKQAIYSLRYRAYLHEGAIEPRSDRRLTDRFDEAPNSWVFGVFVDGQLASSLRISVATPEHPDTPAVDAFPDILKPELARGKIIVDPNRFVAEPHQKLTHLPYMTLRLAYVACSYFNADIGTATARAEHQAFYRRVFLHESLCAPRPYPTLTKPLALMAVNFPAMRDRVFARYPYFRSSFFERRMLFERNSMHPSPALSGPEFPIDSSVAVMPASNMGRGRI